MKRRLAADNRLPTIYAARGVDAGGLMSRSAILPLGIEVTPTLLAGADEVVE